MAKHRRKTDAEEVNQPSWRGQPSNVPENHQSALVCMSRREKRYSRSSQGGHVGQTCHANESLSFNRTPPWKSPPNTVDARMS